MRKFKRFIAVLMCFLLLLPNMGLTVFAAEDESTDMIDIPESSKWEGAVGGDVGGNDKITADNFLIKENEDGSVNMNVKNDRGKIAGSSEGIAYYYQQVDPTDNYEITTKVKIDSIANNSQVGFGIMLRGNLLIDTSVKTGDYLAVGGIRNEIRGFYKYSDSSYMYPDELDFSSINPAPGEEYTIKLRKEGNIYQLSVGEETKTLTDFTGSINYVGLFAARNVGVTYSNIHLNKQKKVQRLEVNSENMKTEYLTDEELNLDWLIVKAIYDNGEETTLSENEYIVTGFDSSTAGTSTITISYGGANAAINLLIKALTLQELSIKYYPAKTVYYPGDKFEPAGLEVFGSFNNGETYKLTADQYDFKIDNVTIDDSFEFTSPGTKIITIVPKEFPTVSTSFNVTVQDTALEELEVMKIPVKTQYFIGDKLDLTGMVVYAIYKDGSQVRLMDNEYKVSGFESAASGNKNVVITHKDISKTIIFNVKEKEALKLKITQLPNTTFTVGDKFGSDGLEVSKIYDNGDQDVLSADAYAVDSSSFNSDKAGTYTITVSPKIDDLEPITYKVTVRKKTEYKFDFMRFGQSTSDEKNAIEYLENGTVRLSAIDGAGKITGDHDGISFYYTEIDANEDNFELSADIKVIEYAKNPHDGQESFGIMARDAIFESGDQKGIFSSNIAAIGGYSGGTKDDNGTQLFVRTGVTSSDGSGSQGIQKEMVKPEKPTADNTKDYRLTLKKTNSGFTGIIDDGKNVTEKEIYAPDILNVQNEKAFIGFYTARVATIEVSNIDLKVTAAKTDAPKEDAPVKEITPQFNILSLDKTSDTNYRLIVQSNVSGSVTIKEGNEVIRYDVPMKAGQKLEIPTTIAKNTNTNFSFVFIPDETQKLTNYDRIIENFTVQMKTYVENGNIYVSPNGSSTGDGSLENPLDLDTAIEFVKPGQYIYVMEGHYVRNGILEIKKYNDGTKNAEKYLWADPEAKTRPVIDFDKKTEGVVHSGNYWHVKGLDFTQSAGNTKGYTVGGNHNIIENVKTYSNGDTGLQISRTDDSNQIDDWPSYNLILNSESFDNRDPSDNNADGFAAKLTVGKGNIFRGTIAHNNIDDGWDLYTKVGTGAIGAVTIEDSIAYNNGFLTDGTIGAGDKNGFKLGGEGVHVPHIIKNSVAFGNGSAGFTSNSNPGVIAENNYAFNNDGGNLVFTTYGHITPDFTIDGFISFFTADRSKKSKDNYQHQVSDKNFMFNGTQSVNKSGFVLPDEVIQSLATIQNFERNQDGSIIWNGVWNMFGDFIAQFEEPKTEIPEEPGEEKPEEPKPEIPEGQNPGNEDDNNQPGEELPNNNKPGDKPPGTDQSDDKTKDNDQKQDGNKLPKTATSIYNWLVVGVLLILVGVSISVIRYRRRGLDS